jgi:hypothetical protein
LVLVPFVLILAAALILLGRLSRWRLHWLMVPALCAACWLAVASPPGAHGLLVAANAIAAQSGRLARLAAGVAAQPARLLHAGPALRAALAGTERSLPAYLLVATVEAAFVLWLGWHRSPPDWRPGLVATQRKRSAIRALTAGRTVTADGCALGVDVAAGRLAGVSWTTAQRGVLLAGHDEQQVASPALAAVCAAVRRRKTVLMLDLAGAHGHLARRTAELAANLGVPAIQVALPRGGLDGLEGAFGRAIRRREVVVISTNPGQAGAQSPPEILAPSETPDPSETPAPPKTQAEREAQAALGAQAAVRTLASVLASLRDLGLRGDCLVWIAGCEAADESILHALLALGPATGTAILMTTLWPTGGDAAIFRRLAESAEVVVIPDTVPGRFAMFRAEGRPPDVIQTVPPETAAVRVS